MENSALVDSFTVKSSIQTCHATIQQRVFGIGADTWRKQLDEWVW
jgi:hypothetical protein